LNAVSRMPSLLAVDSAGVPGPITSLAYVHPLDSAPLAFLLFLPLFLLGLFAVALYLEWIAQGVRPLEKDTPSAALARVSLLWLRLILFSLLLVVFSLAAGFLLSVTPLFIPSPEIGSFAALLLTVGLLWLFIYFFFAPSAMAVSKIGVRAALQRSVLLYRAYFWATLGLVVLSVFLDRGLTLIWSGLTVSPIGVVIGITANAYIGT